MDDNDKDTVILELKKSVTFWRGRAVEAAETACSLCRASDPELCRYCRMNKIHEEAQK